MLDELRAAGFDPEYLLELARWFRRGVGATNRQDSWPVLLAAAERHRLWDLPSADPDGPRDVASAWEALRDAILAITSGFWPADVEERSRRHAEALAVLAGLTDDDRDEGDDDARLVDVDADLHPPPRWRVARVDVTPTRAPALRGQVAA